MKLIQHDAFGDGWYADVQLDTGERVLLHKYDKAGYKAKYPGDKFFLALAAEAAVKPEPVIPTDYHAKYESLKTSVDAIAKDPRLTTKEQIVVELTKVTAAAVAVRV